MRNLRRIMPSFTMLASSKIVYLFIKIIFFSELNKLEADNIKKNATYKQSAGEA